jgi:hypothetical protein
MATILETTANGITIRMSTEYTWGRFPCLHWRHEIKYEPQVLPYRNYTSV